MSLPVRSVKQRNEELTLIKNLRFLIQAPESMVTEMGCEIFKCHKLFLLSVINVLSFVIQRLFIQYFH